MTQPKLNAVDYVLYKTRKNPLEAFRELMIEYDSEWEINLIQCTSCGIWLKPPQLFKDLDGLDICNECKTFNGL
jgi:hypothetical protein